MILGLGNDIVEVARIKASIARHGQKFLDKIFTLHEQAYCLKHKESAINFAGRFAAKEAIVKAFGTGFVGGIVNWLDLEISNDSYGKPFVEITPQLNLHFDSPSLLISISHSDQYAIATAIWFKK